MQGLSWLESKEPQVLDGENDEPLKLWGSNFFYEESPKGKTVLIVLALGKPGDIIVVLSLFVAQVRFTNSLKPSISVE